MIHRQAPAIDVDEPACSTAPSMASPSPKEQLRDARQAAVVGRILDAAEAAFADHGYEAAKVQSVAQAAGVSLSTLYGLLGSKWDVYRAVHARRIEALQAFIRERGDVEGDPLDRMLAGIAAYVQFHMEHPTYLRMHLREGHLWSESSTLRSDEQVDAWEAGRRTMTRAFEVGLEAGLYVEDERPELMARMTLAMHQVWLADWMDRGMQETPAQLMRRIARQFIRTFCRPEVAAKRLALQYS